MRRSEKVYRTRYYLHLDLGLNLTVKLIIIIITLILHEIRLHWMVFNTKKRTFFVSSEFAILHVVLQSNWRKNVPTIGLQFWISHVGVILNEIHVAVTYNVYNSKLTDLYVGTAPYIKIMHVLCTWPSLNLSTLF